jgi:hypothetical protein
MLPSVRVFGSRFDKPPQSHRGTEKIKNLEEHGVEEFLCVSVTLW